MCRFGIFWLYLPGRRWVVRKRTERRLDSAQNTGAAATRAVAAKRQKKGALTCSDPPCILYIQTSQQDCRQRD